MLKNYILVIAFVFTVVSGCGLDTPPYIPQLSEITSMSVKPGTPSMTLQYPINDTTKRLHVLKLLRTAKTVGYDVPKGAVSDLGSTAYSSAWIGPAMLNIQCSDGSSRNVITAFPSFYVYINKSNGSYAMHFLPEEITYAVTRKNKTQITHLISHSLYILLKSYRSPL